MISSSSNGSGGEVKGMIHQPTGSFNSTIDAANIAGTRSWIEIERIIGEITMKRLKKKKSKTQK